MEPLSYPPQLPDDCLYLILGYVPLKHQFRMRTVNQRFNAIICSHFRVQKSLKLFSNIALLADYINALKAHRLTGHSDLAVRKDGKPCDDILLVPFGDQEQPRRCQRLAKLFPNVTNLVCLLQDYRNTLYLVEHWKTKLTTLTVTCSIPYRFQSAMWQSTSSLSNLKRLHLLAKLRHSTNYAFAYYNEYANLVHFVPPKLVSFMDRLEQCTLINSCPHCTLDQGLAARVTRASFEHENTVCLWSSSFYGDSIEHQYSTTLPSLDQFLSIHTLDLTSVDASFFTLMSRLSKLTNLRDIALLISQFTCTRRTDWHQTHYPPPFVQAISAQRLNLIISEKWHKQRGSYIHNHEHYDKPFECLYELHQFMFPSLAKLAIEVRCSDSFRKECFIIRDEAMKRFSSSSIVIEEIA